ncbi:MAG: sulfite exporter TauE/SafE family protein [Candidatus Latescibacterota bacterium]|nr:MAG: sulfite exporter TauE/SafE family protein [Candidatus Latescibacterota bacterium]
MAELFVVAGSAFWLGLLTSVSPCPLATNIAAISYIAREVNQPRRVLFSGVLYTAGRTIAYVGLAVVLVVSLLSAPHVSHILQKYMNKILGPLLILVGMMLLNWINLGWSGSGPGDRFQRRVGSMGMWGAGFMGIGFALSFCPISAALYFGSLLPLALQHNSKILVPALYGIGTALPVVVFAVIIAWSAGSLGKAFSGVTQVERWARVVTGVVFIVVGIYLTLENVFGILP